MAEPSLSVAQNGVLDHHVPANSAPLGRDAKKKEGKKLSATEKRNQRAKAKKAEHKAVRWVFNEVAQFHSS